MEKPIRILHYIKHLETGGGESLVFNIYQHIDRKKVQFDFAVNTEDEERLDEPIRRMGGYIYPITEHEPKITLQKLRKTSAGLEKLLNKHHYDIVHIHCSNGQGLYYSNIARRCGVKNVICHVHNTSVVGRFEQIKAAVHNSFRRKYMGAPTEYFACSLDAARWLYDEAVINGPHYRTIRNGIDVQKFKYSEDDRNEIRSLLGLIDKKVLCTIGRCVKEKNQIFTIHVLEDLIRRDDDFRLILIGQGELEQELHEYVRTHGMSEKVVFIKATDKVEKYLSASDYFLLSSSSSEGLGIVAIEAQANGLMTIVSDNVPDDVLVSPFVKKVQLSEKEHKWAEIIEKWQAESSRNEAGDYINHAGYVIQNVADELQEFYLYLVAQ